MRFDNFRHLPLIAFWEMRTPIGRRISIRQVVITSQYDIKMQNNLRMHKLKSCLYIYHWPLSEIWEHPIGRRISVCQVVLLVNRTWRWDVQNWLYRKYFQSTFVLREQPLTITTSNFSKISVLRLDKSPARIVIITKTFFQKVPISIKVGALKNNGSHGKQKIIWYKCVSRKR